MPLWLPRTSAFLRTGCPYFHEPNAVSQRTFFAGNGTLPSVLILLAIRNVIRNLRRLAPMVVIVVAVFAAMVAGNAVLASSEAALYGTYARLVSGDLSVSAEAESNFTVFGSDQLLIGEYLVAPVIPEFEELTLRVREMEGIRAIAGMVSGAANVQIRGARRNRTVFGVDFGEYAALVPDLELLAGELPRAGEPGILVQEEWLGADESPTALLGQPALLASGSGRTFTLREVPVRGVFRYPVEDELLSTVVLVDADTARALNGYIYGALEEVQLTEETQQILDTAVDDLFGDTTADGAAPGDGGGAGDTTASDAPGAIDLDALLGGGAGTAGMGADGADGDEATDAATVDRARQAIAGSWNFLLVSLENPRDLAATMRRIEGAGFDGTAGYRVRDWYRTIGGNASLVRYLQILFNAGLVFVAVGAAIVATNALMLSVLERTAEIGTMRALGAGRERVALMIALETILVVVGSAALGILAGTLAVRSLNNAAYVIDNRYVAILFGGEPVRGMVTLSLVGNHLAAAAALGAVSLLYPLRRALAVSPREAMSA